MWLNEGMADIYATFEVTGDHAVRVGKPQPIYLKLLATEPLEPLSALFAVTHDSPEYNERERQGIFYAESWLLTHYLMVGNPAHQARLGNLTLRLREGQAPEQAFTNTFRASLAVMDKELAHYYQQGRFESLALAVRASLLTAQPLTTRAVGPVETWFRLGDELMRVGRADGAESFFLSAAKLAPASSLSCEGLGLLAAERGQHRQALETLKEAIRLGSRSFLAHYACGRERLILSSPTPDSYTRLEGAEAAEVQRELDTALTLMPDFGPAHHLLGFFQLVQGENLASAEQHLKRAIQLEPDNAGYLLTLAQVQIAGHDQVSARGTLEALCQPYINGKLRAHAEEMIKDLGPALR
jgi:tetratricopeptide (TPR) repeat protein